MLVLLEILDPIYIDIKSNNVQSSTENTLLEKLRYTGHLTTKIGAFYDCLISCFRSKEK